jgi:t-SNARE complex subunit (syntaxin)
MPHPHEYLLKEYQVAIDRLAPTVPQEIRDRARARLSNLMADPDATEDEIRGALFETGREEYPHRHAFGELTAGGIEARRVEITLEHVEPGVAERVKRLVDSGVTMNELTNSRLFESEFTPEERHQVEDALLDADIHVKEEFGKSVVSDEKAYAAAVKRWEKRRDDIQVKIDELETLRSRDEKWRADIEEKVKRFREGFSVTEPDPELEEVEKEIEYWKGTFGEET